MSRIAQRCNWKASVEEGAHQSRRFHSIFLPFYYQKINPAWWDLKSWPPLIYYLSLCLPWSCTLEGGLRERRLLSWGGIMMRSAGKRGCWKNKTSQQHSRWFYALYLCALGTWRLGGCRMQAHVREVFLSGLSQSLPYSVEKRKQSLLWLENEYCNKF